MRNLLLPTKPLDSVVGPNPEGCEQLLAIAQIVFGFFFLPNILVNGVLGTRGPPCPFDLNAIQGVQELLNKCNNICSVHYSIFFFFKKVLPVIQCYNKNDLKMFILFFFIISTFETVVYI